MNNSPLLCPVCHASLETDSHTYRCANNHGFDLAKEGYLNLLLSHQRKSKNPGDDKAMVQARRRFFDSGAYDPLKEKLTSLISEGTLLDAGCGEGTLSGALAGQVIGIDISKDAIRLAAKRYKDVTWIVANGMRELPFTRRSFDSVLSVLAPRNVEEFTRILKPDGQLILGVPGPNHLIELRTLLHAGISDFEEKADEADAKCTPFFKEKTRNLLTHHVRLDKPQIADLIQMTPIFWNSSPQAKETVQQLDELEITVSFVIQSFGVRR